MPQFTETEAALARLLTALNESRSLLRTAARGAPLPEAVAKALAAVLVKADSAAEAIWAEVESQLL